MNRYLNCRRYVQFLMTFTAGLLLLAMPALAQTSSGDIYGKITDTTGSTLPGVTVTAESNGLRNTFVTDTDGAFRFLRLPPGRYTVTAELSGFSTVRRQIDVNIGTSPNLDLVLSPQMSETVTVTGETPLIDTREMGTSSVVTQEEIEQLPTARDPWVMLQMTPGVLVDRVNVGGNKSGQQSYFVSKGAERHQTAWNIDGVNVTEMDETGTSTFYYDFGSLQEFQIVTSSADPFVRTPGVQVNMVTKRGSNDFSGTGRIVWADEALQADATLPGTVREGNRIDNVTEQGIDFGGPILRDRVWFYGAYSNNTISNVTSSHLFPQRTELINWTAKISAQPVTNNNASLYYMFSDKTVNARDLSATRPPETARRQSGPGWVAKLEDTHVFSNNFVLTGLVARVDSGYKQEPRGGMDIEPVWINSAGLNGGMARGWHNTYRLSEQILEQNNYRADASTFFQTGDISHEVKFGAGYRDQNTEWWVIWPGEMYWTEYWVTSRGRPFQYVVPTRPAHPIYDGEYTDFYIGDTVQLGNLTIQGGARYDLQRAYNLPSDVPANPLVPDVLPATSYAGDDRKLEWESITPRLGMTYAFGEQKQTVVKASYSRYVDQMGSSEVGASNPFYNDQGLYYYWSDANGDQRVQRNEIDFEYGGFYHFNLDPDDLSSGAPSVGRIDYDNHEPTRTEEYIIGVQHEILSGWAVGLNYTHRMRDNFIWNQYEKTRGAGDFYTPADYEVAGTLEAITSWGEHVSVPYHRVKAGIGTPTYYVARNRPDYSQTYDGLELIFQRRTAGRWMARGQVTFGDWKQNVGPRGIQNPGRILEGDGCYTCDDTPVASSSGTDGYINARWSYSLSGLYQGPWGINFGAVVTGREGYINGYNIRSPNIDGARRRYVINNFEDYRFSNLFQVDLRVGKEFALPGGRSFEVSVDGFNLSNERTILWREYEIVPTRVNGQLVASPETPIQEIQSPRIYRLGARLTF
ncbi:MAG TPA: TonB-dependent receptor [Thermoanaerobaculia bacterium]|nr:TonB-dependent receptor [Thermoanaerobaculia bacterium]